MRVSVLQISWHDQKPVFTTDCAPNGLLATGGADNNVRVWHTIPRVYVWDRIARGLSLPSLWEQCQPVVVGRREPGLG